MLDEIKNINSSKAELKKFGTTIGIVLIIVAAILFFIRMIFSTILPAADYC